MVLRAMTWPLSQLSRLNHARQQLSCTDDPHVELLYHQCKSPVAHIIRKEHAIQLLCMHTGFLAVLVSNDCGQRNKGNCVRRDSVLFGVNQDIKGQHTFLFTFS